jgi:hypothetical protein
MGGIVGLGKFPVVSWEGLSDGRRCETYVLRTTVFNFIRTLRSYIFRTSVILSRCRTSELIHFIKLSRLLNPFPCTLLVPIFFCFFSTS